MISRCWKWGWLALSSALPLRIALQLAAAPPQAKPKLPGILRGNEGERRPAMLKAAGCAAMRARGSRSARIVHF